MGEILYMVFIALAIVAGIGIYYIVVERKHDNIGSEKNDIEKMRENIKNETMRNVRENLKGPRP